MEEEIVNIVFGSAGLYLPRSKKWITIGRKLLDLLEEDIKEELKEREKSRVCFDCKPKELSNSIQDESGVVSIEQGEDRPQGLIGAGKETDVQTSPKPETSFKLIPKFDWDKTKEKSYRTIFFVELEDGRVGISYFNSKTFTTKEAVLSIPFPVPYGYKPLANVGGNRRTAIRLYRGYLFNEAQHQEIIGTDEQAKEPASQREERLKKQVELNQKRWDARQKEEKGEMSERTKELRKSILSIPP